MANKMRVDRYSMFLFGLEADLPDAVNVNPRTVYVTTDTGFVYFEKDGAWVKAPNLPDWSAFATNPHGNSQHIGDMAKGMIGFTSYEVAPIPTGAEIWKMIVPDISLPGMSLQADAITAHVGAAPVADITFTVKQNGTAIGSVVITSGQVSGETALDPEVEISANDVITVDAPSDLQGATGLCLYLVVKRVAGVS